MSRDFTTVSHECSYTESAGKPRVIQSTISSIRLTRKTNGKEARHCLKDLSVVLINSLCFTTVPLEGASMLFSGFPLHLE